jgi:hypothetical protein
MPQGRTNRKIIVQVGQGKKQDPISKITNTEGLVEWLKW